LLSQAPRQPSSLLKHVVSYEGAHKVRRLSTVASALLLVTAASAYMMAPLEIARHESSIVVVGTVLSIVDAGRREISFPGLDSEHWLFEHSVARVAVLEVVKAPTSAAVATGDTVDIYFCTSSEAFKPGASRAAASISDVAMPAPPIRGETATYCVSRSEGEDRFMCRLSDSDLQQVRMDLSQLRR
jgi:hypothetical protein